MLMWGRLRLWFMKSDEQRYRKDAEEATNEKAGKEQNSREQKLALWKDRANAAKLEIPDGVFQMLQKQHDLGEDDS